MSIANAVSLLGGLALFLYGMSLMGDSLKKVAGSKLETVLEKLTANRLLGVLLGAVVTAVIQSSSATSVMVIGFVNSGMMKLSQAIGVIMGANIGTTATAWILSISSVKSSALGELLSVGTISAVIALVGIVFYMFSKTQKKVHIGGIMLGFAVLMFGMTSMSQAVAPLKDSQTFVSMLKVFSNPVLGILVGMIFTAVIQSSSASVGVLQALSVSVGIKYSAVFPLVLGMNIGACVPVLIAGFSANKNGKRTGLVYLYFNALGTAVFLAIYYIIGIFIDYSVLTEKLSDPVGIAVFNTVYKLFSTLVLLPFTGLIEKLICISVPDRKGEDEESVELLDEHFLAYPPLAVERCNSTVSRMAGIARKNIIASLSLITDWDSKTSEKINEKEEIIDRYEDKLGSYLVKLSSRELSVDEVNQVTRCLHCIGDIERIGDHAVNITEAAAEINEKNIVFSEGAYKELETMTAAITEILSLTFTAFEKNDPITAAKVEPLEEVIDMLRSTMKSNHVARLSNSECTLLTGFVFNDLLGNFERVADHCSNIAACIIQLTTNDSSLDTHEYLRNYKEESLFGKDFEKYKKEYFDKIT
ncbi:MAG: Na/Pi cotransporter family protein [Clostridia bacterium]|nr:Na/Pi cotransporter family protein [Clostridia bacterium]